MPEDATLSLNLASNVLQAAMKLRRTEPDLQRAAEAFRYLRTANEPLSAWLKSVLTLAYEDEDDHVY